MDRSKGHNLIAGGYTVEDTTRHFDKFSSEPQIKDYGTEFEVLGYDDILNALLAAGADLSQIGHDSTPALYRAMMFAADQQDDYVIYLLWDISEKAKMDELPATIDFAITLARARHRAETTVLSDAFLPRAKETTWETVARLISGHQFSLITDLYKAGAKFTTTSVEGVSILHKFVQYGLHQLIDHCYYPQEVAMPENGQQAPERNQDGPESLLMVACRRSTSNMEVIRILVEKKGVNIKAQGPNGITALHILAVGKYWWQHALAIPYLVSKGADLEARNTDGCTPLLYSSTQWGAFRAAAMKTLIDYGADVNVLCNRGLGCLNHATQNEGLVRLLVRHGAEVLPMTIMNAIQQGNVDTLRILLSGNGQPGLAALWKLKLDDAKHMDLDANPLQAQLIRQGHPLFTASTEGAAFMPSVSDTLSKVRHSVKGEMMKALMAVGFSPYDTFAFRPVYKRRAPYRPSLPMAIANQSWQEKDEEFGIISGLGLGSPRLTNRVVMHEIFSSDSGYYEPILELPDLDLEFRDKAGRTLLLASCHPFAVDNQGRNVVHLILGSSVLDDDMLEAVKDLGDVLPHLINQSDAKGYRPLHYGLAAVAAGGSLHAEASWVDYIITQGADMLAVDAHGNNALHYLASIIFGHSGYSGDRAEILFKKFINMGLDINARNRAGQTPIFFVVGDLRDQPVLREKINWLDGLGVDWQARDEQRRTILHGIAGEPAELFKVVMERGVDPLAEDIDGRTSLDLAAGLENYEVLKLFDRAGE
ncbi:hypothetical protein NXS19_001967 [Fusarium pseudograminearum]|nr:hypothetical protein NXS19_001967 [Fusarium pseudograminearum]